ncbi:MAG: hypothetical protein ACYDCL_00290 [Myxococcales bacterium]
MGRSAAFSKSCFLGLLVPCAFVSLLAAAASGRVTYRPGEAITAAVPEAAAQRILSSLFPRRLGSPAACPTDAGTPAQARAAGLIVPTVDARAVAPDGARLTLVSVHACGADTPVSPQAQILIVERPGQPALHLELAGRWSLERLLPVRRGPPALLLATGDTNMGRTVSRAAIFGIEGKRLLQIQDLGLVYDDDCGTLRPTGADSRPIEIAVPLEVGPDGAPKAPAWRKLPRVHRDCG